MTDQDRYIAGVPCWVDAVQPDPEAGVAFYGELFGWEFEDVMPPGAPGRYFVARMRGGDVAAVGSQPEGGPPAATWNTYVWVDDADETAAKVRAAGGMMLVEPSDVMDEGRMAVFADPAGAQFFVWQPRRHRGAAVVNEHASLNFNVLHTPDGGGARDFYGAVFGWDVLDTGGAGAMWALPAYGDFLEERTPGMRANIAQMGAPARFEEVVAALAPAADARWDVTFAVDDADAIAARATDLGGAVIAPPADVPWARTTIIADPQGAMFTASQFVPTNRDVPQETGAGQR